jgi:hypothetical protein
MVHSNPRGQGGLELSGCLRYLVSRITHHVDDVLWPFDSVLTTLKGAHDDESDESDEPSSFTPDTISYSGSPYRRVAKPLDIAPEHSRFAWRKIDIRYWPSVLLGKDISGLRRLHPWNAKIIAAVRPRWFIREGLPASLTRWMHQSTEKTVLEQSPQILVAALRPLAVGHGATLKPPEPAISACELSANWRSASQDRSAIARPSPRKGLVCHLNRVLPFSGLSFQPECTSPDSPLPCWLGKLTSACSTRAARGPAAASSESAIGVTCR